MTFDEFQNKYNIILNQQQQVAVQTVDGPVLLLAVPGSGKTTVLVTRLGYMIYCKGIPPENILTLTYTIAATRDMADRFEKYFGAELRERMEFRTINGVCARVIHYFGRLIGKSSFQLVTEEKSTAGMLSLIFQDIEGTYPTEGDMKDVRSLITYIKNMMLSQKQMEELKKEAGFQISEIYKRYCEEMRKQGLMDYDDQMIYALNILRKSPETLQYFQSCYPYICVDEAQDTSKIQHEIIALLARGKDNLFMVGDEDQSIYGFRAAYPKAILSFEKNHPGAKVLLMEENFRSNANIVTAADKFIQKNTNRHVKHMRAFRAAGADVREIELKSRKAQYTYLEKVAVGCQTQTAVLYRDNESVLPLVDRLERNGIPYCMRNAELTFFTHRIVTDILNIIRFAMNPKDTELFMQIYFKINLYINKQNAMRFCEISAEKGMSVLEAAVRYGDFPDYTVRSIRDICMHLEGMQKEAADKAIYRIVKLMGYGEYLERMGMNDGKIFIMKEIACMEQSVESFLHRMMELSRIIKEKENDPKCPFILSTIHASKGLEYDTVYLLDVMDGILPEKVLMSQKKAEPKEWENYEEERRLFYVGVTRAKNHLNLFKVPNTSTFGKELIGKTPKREITSGQGRLQKQIQGKSPVKPKKIFSQEEYEAFCDALGEGIGVVHKKYGQGVVAESSEEYVTVQFGGTERKFQLKFLFESELLRVE
ncbi:MAG: ATP-dependent helicase [Lachnospiraceae bacterium]|nr:ATP-dependent helicase [Lachnospiraceae bacterium]